MTLELILKAMGKNISEIRRTQRLTQKDAAKKMGISYRYLQSIEGGSVNLTLSTLFRIASFFGVHVSDLLSFRRH